MPNLILGSRLNSDQRRAVLAAFVHRHTIENGRRFPSGCALCHYRGDSLPGKSLAEWHAYHIRAITDAEWITSHAFYVRKDGSLCESRHAEPAYLADAK